MYTEVGMVIVFKIYLGGFLYIFFVGEEVSRSYTPIPPTIFQTNDKDCVVSDVYLLIKKYPHGMLSPVVCGSKKGDILELSTPLGPFELRSIENREAFLCVAAGTGITPIIGFLSCVLERRNRRW